MFKKSKRLPCGGEFQIVTVLAAVTLLLDIGANSCTGDEFDNFHFLFSKCGNVITRFLPSGT